MSVETAREIALLREALEAARHAARELYAYVLERNAAMEREWEELHPWIRGRVTPPPDAPLSPEDVDRITGGARLPVQKPLWWDAMHDLIERVTALEERVTALG